MVVPDMLQKHRACHDLSGVLHEILEKPELARLEHDLRTGASDAVGEAIEFQVADAVEGRLGRRRRAPPAGQNLDPGEELGEGVGFGEIVVAPGPQALDPVVYLAERGQDQDRRLASLLAQGPDQGEAVELRQHAVDDEDVVVPALGHAVSVEPVGRVIHHVARLAEGLDEVGRRLAIILDDQDAHGETPPARARRRTGRTTGERGVILMGAL